MNTNMFENPIVQDNIKKLEHYGFHIIDPASGYLACGDTGAGKMPEPETLFSYIMKDLACEKDMVGKKVMVTAGPTQEKLIRCVILRITLPEKWAMQLRKTCMRRRHRNGNAGVHEKNRWQSLRRRFVKVVPVVYPNKWGENCNMSTAFGYCDERITSLRWFPISHSIR